MTTPSALPRRYNPALPRRVAQYTTELLALSAAAGGLLAMLAGW